MKPTKETGTETAKLTGQCAVDYAVIKESLNITKELVRNLDPVFINNFAARIPVPEAIIDGFRLSYSAAESSFRLYNASATVVSETFFDIDILARLLAVRAAVNRALAARIKAVLTSEKIAADHAELSTVMEHQVVIEQHKKFFNYRFVHVQITSDSSCLLVTSGRHAFHAVAVKMYVKDRSRTEQPYENSAPSTYVLQKQELGKSLFSMFAEASMKLVADQLFYDERRKAIAACWDVFVTGGKKMWREDGLYDANVHYKDTTDSIEFTLEDKSGRHVQGNMEAFVLETHKRLKPSSEKSPEKSFNQLKPESDGSGDDSMDFSIRLKQKWSLADLVNFIFENGNHRIAVNVTNNEGKLLFGIRLESKEGVKLLETSLYAPTPGMVVNFIQYLRKAFLDNSLSDD